MGELNLTKILLTEKHKHKERDTSAKEASDVIKFDKKNNHKLAVVIKKMEKLFRAGIYSYGNYPEWVLKSWAESDGRRAIPLEDDKWLDTKIPFSTDDEDDEIYSGNIVDDSRTIIKGQTALSIQKSKMVDNKKFKRLKIYAFLMNMVKRVQEKRLQKEKYKEYIEKEKMEKEQKKGMMQNGQQNPTQNMGGNQQQQGNNNAQGNEVSGFNQGNG